MKEPKKTGGCVICGNPKDERYKPFCSKRCADVDLNRWFSGAYAIPAVESDDPKSDESQS
ncbi:MAG: DNA gyrase inhibitor YacG [Hyphomonadaceae bacterium]|nr:DNA gyrase inhibitor YacG [Hyphomonadaceae bacterium]